jgi:hypothetical protein
VSSARPHLNAGEVEELEELIIKFHNVFAMKSDGYGGNDRMYHRIDNSVACPIQPPPPPPRRLPLAKHAEIDKMLKDMKGCGVIEELECPWSSPMVLIRNKNRDLRFCVHYL